MVSLLRYALCKLAAGVLGGSKTIANVSIQDIFKDPRDKVSRAQVIMPLAVAGASAGALIGMALYMATGRLMAGGWVALVLALAGGIMTAVAVPHYLPPPTTSSEPPGCKVDAGGGKALGGSGTAAGPGDAGGGEAARRKKGLSPSARAAGPAASPARQPDYAGPPPGFDMSAAREALPRGVYRDILVAHALDSVGTAGLMSALTLILYTRFVFFVRHPAEAALTSFGLILFIFLGILVAIPSLRRNGAGFNAVAGNAATAAAQVVLIFCTTSGAFLAVVYAGVALSFYSTVAYMPMLVEISPPGMRGEVMGRYGAIHNFANSVTPLVVALVVDTLGETAALALTACFSLAGFAKALPLRSRFPPKGPSLALTAEEQAHIDGDPNWISIPRLLEINTERMKLGEPNLRLRFGSFERDRDRLGLIHKCAARDLADMRAWCMSLTEIIEAGGVPAESLQRTMAGRARVEDERFQSGGCDDEAKELGLWVSSYLNHAGHPWNKYPTLYKLLIMNAFPPMPRLDRGAPVDQVSFSFVALADREMHLMRGDPFGSYSAVGRYQGSSSYPCGLRLT